MWIINLKFTCEVKMTIHSFTFSSGKQDSNLRPPASKAGKQPPLSFQFSDSLQNSFPRDSRIGNFSMNLYNNLEWIVNCQFALLSILYSLYLRNFKIHLRSKIHYSQLTIKHSHSWVSSGIEPCFPVPQTGALPNKLKKP